jgi:tetratricopeptide (TPR) repeat protein
MRKATLILILWSFACPAIGKEPRTAQEYFNRGTVRYRAADYTGAIGDFTLAISINSNFPSRFSGTAYVSTKIVVMDKFNALASYNRALSRFRAGDLQGAIQDFDNAIAIYPKNSMAFNNRGLVLYETHDLEGAVRDYKRAIELDFRNFLAHNNLGIVHFDVQEYREAVSEYTRAIQINPHVAITFNNRGNSLLALGDFEAAISDYTNAIGVDPNLLIAYWNRGRALIRQGREAEAAMDFAQYRDGGGKEPGGDTPLFESPNLDMHKR